jgi:hypothetical protein
MTDSSCRSVPVLLASLGLLGGCIQSEVASPEPDAQADSGRRAEGIAPGQDGGPANCDTPSSARSEREITFLLRNDSDVELFIGTTSAGGVFSA